VYVPFTVDDFQDLVRLLDQHPEWRAELRRLLLPEQVLELPAIVARLAEAQARTEAQLATLTARVDALAEAQARTEERLQALTDRVDALAASVDDLAGQVQMLRHEVGRLVEGVSTNAELEAGRVLVRVLGSKGYRLLDRPRPVAVDGEVDVAVQVQDPAGETFSVVTEAKFRLQRGDILAWHRRLGNQAFIARLAARGLALPLLPYAFGLQVYEGAERAGAETGIGVLHVDGELVAPSPRGAPAG
jgi:hypothetical protein